MDHSSKEFYRNRQFKKKSVQYKRGKDTVIRKQKEKRIIQNGRRKVEDIIRNEERYKEREKERKRKENE
jgi:hypothetical protein